MAKLDEIKEFIGFLKAVFITTIVIMSSLVAYLYKKPIEENYLVLIAFNSRYSSIISFAKNYTKTH